MAGVLSTDSSLTKDFVAGDPSLTADNLEKKKKTRKGTCHEAPKCRELDSAQLLTPRRFPWGVGGEVSFHF